jgi:hypothetical protein
LIFFWFSTRYQAVECSSVLDEHGIDIKTLIPVSDLVFKEKLGSGITAIVYRGVWYKRINDDDDDDNDNDVVDAVVKPI